MTKLEKMKALRNDPAVHYNCCQSVLMPFAEECRISEEAACKLGAHFGGGMRMGSVCGALVGALMALGAMDCGDEARKKLVEEFKAKHECLNCADLLKRAVDQGVPRKVHCDGRVEECVTLVEELSGKH